MGAQTSCLLEFGRYRSDLTAEASPVVARKCMVSSAEYDADGTQFGMETKAAVYVALAARRWG